MKQALLCISFITLLISCKKDPAPPVTSAPVSFQKTYGGSQDDIGKAVVQTPDKGYIIVGSTISYGNGGKDMYVIKIDSTGKEVVHQTYGGANDDEGNEIIAASDGNYVIAGTTASYGVSGTNVWLMKIDLNGNQLWQINYGGAANESAEDVMETTDGGYLITGLTTSFGSGGRDMYLVKTDVNGTILWTQTHGGTADDGGMSLAKADGNNIMVFGFTDNYGAVNRDWYLMKINSTGDSLNSWLYGTSEYEEAESIEPTNDGNYLLFGHTAGFGHIEHNMYAAKVSPAGTVLWQNNYGGAMHDGGEHGKQSSDGGYILAGRSMSFGTGTEEMYLVKTDASGNQSWEKHFGYDMDDAAYNMIETSNGYVLVGNSQNVSNGNYDVFLVKILK